MAKLDKNQQKYALDRINSMAHTAANKAAYVLEVVDNKTLIEKLRAKGFTASSDYNLNRYISITKTPAQLAAIEKAKAAATNKQKDIYAAAQAAKDQVMLGDSIEVAQILTDLAKKWNV